MNDEQFDRYFEVVLPDTCISLLRVYLKDRIISQVEFEGGCEFNLKVLRDNLVGEHVEFAAVVVQEVCKGVNLPCVGCLRKTLASWFSQFLEDL